MAAHDKAEIATVNVLDMLKDFAADHQGGYTVEEILAWYQGKGDEYREQTLLSDCAKDYIQSLKH